MTRFEYEFLVRDLLGEDPRHITLHNTLIRGLLYNARLGGRGPNNDECRVDMEAQRARFTAECNALREAQKEREASLHQEARQRVTRERMMPGLADYIDDEEDDFTDGGINGLGPASTSTPPVFSEPGPHRLIGVASTSSSAAGASSSRMAAEGTAAKPPKDKKRKRSSTHSSDTTHGKKSRHDRGKSVSGQLHLPTELPENVMADDITDKMSESFPGVPTMSKSPNGRLTRKISGNFPRGSLLTSAIGASPPQLPTSAISTTSQSQMRNPFAFSDRKHSVQQAISQFERLGIRPGGDPVALLLLDKLFPAPTAEPLSVSEEHDIPSREQLVFRMEQLSRQQGLNRVQPGCADMVLQALLEYLRRLIAKCVELRKPLASTNVPESSTPPPSMMVMSAAPHGDEDHQQEQQRVISPRDLLRLVCFAPRLVGEDHEKWRERIAELAWDVNDEVESHDNSF